MTEDPTDQGLPPNADALRREQSRLARLTRRLPEATVEILAREVLTGLGKRNAPLPGQKPDGLPAVTPESIERLARALIADEKDPATDMVFNLFEEGAGLDHVYLDHLAPAARLLGAWWDLDEISFSDVAIGTGRIYGIMRHVRTYAGPAAAGDRTRSAVFAAVPGEAHTLGITMAADLFRERGWKVKALLGRSHDEIMTEISRDRSPVIGLSSGGPRTVEPLARLIVAIRMARPTAHVMVGGAAIRQAGSRVRLSDPDSTVSDMKQAQALIDRLEAKYPAR